MRKAGLLFVLFLGGIQTLLAQHTVQLRVAALPSYHKAADAIFIAGSFNNWDPGSQSYQLVANGSGAYSISLKLPPGRYEYKLTRGNWSRGESAGAAGIDNRVMEISSDTTIVISVKDWSDHFPKAPRVSTANSHVQIIDTAFYMPQLNRYRRIWIYLPESYATSNKKYPVLYMHDGQNVFDALYGFGGE